MTTVFASKRSVIRQLLMTAAGILLLVAALDIVSLHRLSDPPTTNDDGVLTSKGQTERRTDIAWGSLFTAVGSSLVVVGLGGLLTARPMVELTDESIRLRVAGPLSMLEIPWEDIVAVRSGSDHEDGGVVPVPVLLVEVEDRAVYPDGLWGAAWKGNTLQVDADGWETSVEDVVIRAQLQVGIPEEGDYQ
jgi:hypothetical protein